MLKPAALLLLYASAAFSATPAKMPLKSFDKKLRFQIAIEKNLDPSLIKEINEAMKSFKYQALPAGAVRPFGISFDQVYIGPERQVVAFTNKFLLGNQPENSLYSLKGDFLFYRTIKTSDQPVSVVLGNISATQAKVISQAFLEMQKSPGQVGMNDFLNLILPQAVAAEIGSSISNGAAVVMDAVSSQAKAEWEAMKNSENYSRSMAGCAQGYAGLWETYWAKPVRTAATMVIHPIDSAKAIKSEALAFWDGGGQMIADYFSEAYKNIKNFGSWPLEQKSALFCQIGAPTVIKAYFPKGLPTAREALALEIQRAEKAAKAAAEKAAAEVKLPKLPKYSQAQLIEMGVPEKLAKRMAGNPQMTDTYLKLSGEHRAATHSGIWEIDEGIAGKFPTTRTGTYYGTEKLRILPDGSIAISYYSDLYYSNSAAMAPRIHNNIQKAIADTRAATGNPNWAPVSLRSGGPSVNPPGYEHWARIGGHDGFAMLTLKGDAADMIFLKSLKDSQFSYNQVAPMIHAPVPIH